MQQLPFRGLLALTLASQLFGCTAGARPSTGDGGPLHDANLPPGSGLRVEPADFEATIAGSPVVVDYHAILRAVDGSERDVTAEVSWDSTVVALGSFTGSQFTSATDRGGVTSIRAIMGGLAGTTRLTLHLERDIVTPGTPADAPTRFGGTADPSRAPELVYPLDGTMVPPNLQQLEFHYLPSGGELFQLAISTGVVNLRIYFGCPESVGGGCIYTPDRATWETLANAARGAGPITYRLRSVDAAGNLGETSERTISFAEQDITGGLYYWNAAAGTIMRFDFGVRGAREETFIDRARTGAFMCVGCHTLSRDGTRIGVGTDTPTTTFQVFDTATRTRIFSLMGTGGGPLGGPQQSNFNSFSPDNAQIVGSSLEGLRILSGLDGTVIEDHLGGGQASMPDWSPDGDHIVFVRHDAPSVLGLFDTTGVVGGRITRLDRSGGSWTVGPTLVSTAGQNNYNPSFSPDGEWVIFNRSPSNTSSLGADPEGGTSSVPDAEIWVVPSSGEGAAIPLDAIHGLSDTWPKFDPTAYENEGHTLFWFAWASRRGYGLRLETDTRSQIWMAAFDPTRTGEPARVPFWLPFQNMETGNHIAQWVTHIERQTCTTDADCGGEFCVDGFCFDEVPVF